jgi:hypothetical protein
LERDPGKMPAATRRRSSFDLAELLDSSRLTVEAWSAQLRRDYPLNADPHCQQFRFVYAIRAARSEARAGDHLDYFLASRTMLSISIGAVRSAHRRGKRVERGRVGNDQATL